MIPDLERLAEALETVRRLCPDLPVLAIRWMHVKHPLHAVQEALMREGRAATVTTSARYSLRGRLNILQDWWVFVRAVARCVWYALYLSCQLVYLRIVLWRQIRRLTRQPFDVIAKTCCLAFERSPDGRDLYYGDLQHRMAQRGIRMLLLCSDILDRRWARFASRQIATAPVCRLPELCLVHPLTPFAMMGKQLRSFWRLQRLARRLDDPLLHKVAVLASRDSLLPDTAFLGLSFWIAKRAVHAWRPRAFMTFYEGHAWERCAWLGVRAADPLCRTVGYQHAMLFQEALSLTAPSNGSMGVLPDLVLCLGQVPLELMRPGHQPHPVRLLRFGALRYQCLQAERPADVRRRTILVTPEGHEREARALFTFAYDCARRLPEHRFIFRMQPGVPLPSVSELIEGYAARQPNIVVSNQPDINDDYRQSSMLMYRASTSVLCGVLQGLLPVWVSLEPLMKTDPLSMMYTWRRACASAEEFAAVVKADEQMPAHQRESEWRTAADYLARYAEPVEDQAIDEFLSAIGLATSVRNGTATSGG